jgi:hypothetical protein
MGWGLNQIDLDELLSCQAKSLFDLDDLSWELLKAVSHRGPTTVYSMAKAVPRERPAVYRRLRGSKDRVGLEKDDYLRVVETRVPATYEDLRRQLTRKYYGLTFKGFLASLAVTRLEENYLFQAFMKLLDKTVPGAQELLTEYIKTELAAWLQSHIENGLHLTHLKSALRYYLGTKDIERLFGKPEEAVEPILTEESLDPRILVPELEEFRRTYSETWEKLNQRRIDLKNYIYETTHLPVETLDRILKYWPILMLREYKRKQLKPKLRKT